MNQELTDQELADALRAKAQKYLKMAEELDGKTVTSVAIQTRVPAAARFYGGGEAVPTVDAIKKLILGGQKLRVKGIAAHLGATVETIKRLVNDPANGLSDKDRGWVKIVSAQ